MAIKVGVIGIDHGHIFGMLGGMKPRIMQRAIYHQLPSSVTGSTDRARFGR